MISVKACILVNLLNLIIPKQCSSYLYTSRLVEIFNISIKTEIIFYNWVIEFPKHAKNLFIQFGTTNWVIDITLIKFLFIVAFAWNQFFAEVLSIEVLFFIFKIRRVATFFSLELGFLIWKPLAFIKTGSSTNFIKSFIPNIFLLTFL